MASTDDRPQLSKRTLAYAVVGVIFFIGAFVLVFRGFYPRQPALRPEPARVTATNAVPPQPPAETPPGPVVEPGAAAKAAGNDANMACGEAREAAKEACAAAAEAQNAAEQVQGEAAEEARKAADKAMDAAAGAEAAGAKAKEAAQKAWSEATDEAGEAAKRAGTEARQAAGMATAGASRAWRAAYQARSLFEKAEEDRLYAASLRDLVSQADNLAQRLSKMRMLAYAAVALVVVIAVAILLVPLLLHRLLSSVREERVLLARLTDCSNLGTESGFGGNTLWHAAYRLLKVTLSPETRRERQEHREWLEQLLMALGEAMNKAQDEERKRHAQTVALLQSLLQARAVPSKAAPEAKPVFEAPSLVVKPPEPAPAPVSNLGALIRAVEAARGELPAAPAGQRESLNLLVTHAEHTAAWYGELESLLADPNLSRRRVEEKALAWWRAFIAPLFPTNGRIGLFPAAVREAAQNLPGFAEMVDALARVAAGGRKKLEERLQLQPFGSVGETVEPDQRGYQVKWQMDVGEAQHMKVIEVRAPGYRVTLPGGTAVPLIEAQVTLGWHRPQQQPEVASRRSFRSYFAPTAKQGEEEIAELTSALAAAQEERSSVENEDWFTSNALLGHAESTVKAYGRLQAFLAQRPFRLEQVQALAGEWRYNFLKPVFASETTGGVYSASYRQAAEKYPALGRMLAALEALRERARQRLQEELALERFGAEGERVKPGQPGYEITCQDCADPALDRQVLEVQAPGYRVTVEGEPYVLQPAAVTAYRCEPAKATERGPVGGVLEESTSGEGAPQQAAPEAREMQEAEPEDEGRTRPVGGNRHGEH